MTNNLKIILENMDGSTTYYLLYKNRLLQSNLKKEVTFNTKQKWPYKKGGHLKESNSYDRTGKGKRQIQVNA
jgi:hypothetical protein